MEETPDNKLRGTDAIAERFGTIATGSQVSLVAPADASPDLVQEGYEC